MQIIEIAPQSNGAHRNQTVNGTVTPPDGWAIIPDGMEIPDSFPFVGVEAENGVVTALTPGEAPEPTPDPEPEPTQMDRIEAQVTYTAMVTNTLLEEV